MNENKKLLVYVLGAIALVALISLLISICVFQNSKCDCDSHFEMDGDNKCDRCGGYLKHKHASINGRCFYCGECTEHTDKNSDGICDNCRAKA